MSDSQPSFSLAARLRAILWAMLLLPIVSGVAFFLVHSGRTLQNQAVSGLTAALRLQQQFVEQWVGERIGDIGYLANDPRVLSLPPESLGALLKSVLQHAPGFADIVYVDETGHTRVDPKHSIGVDLSDREYFKAAQRGESHVSDVLESRLTGTRVFVVSVPVRDAAGKFRGLMLGAVNLSTLSTLMQTVQDESASRTFLMRADGELIAPAGSGPGLKPGDTLFERARTNAPSRGIYRNAEGVRVVGTYRWVLDGKWLLAAERPEADIMATHAWVLGVPLLGALVVFLFFGPMALRLARSLEAPLKRLEEHARQIEAGNFEVDCTPLPGTGTPAEVLRLNQAYCMMVDRVRAALDALREASFTDHLTGAANRKQLFYEGPRMLDSARRAGTPASLLMLDLDHFKRVNDTHGHAAGDAVLASFSALLRSTLRKSDLFARYGGEEFVVLAPNADLAHGLELAERIRQAVERLEVLCGEAALRFTVSIGVASLEGPPAGKPAADGASSEPLEGLLARADEALYAAKAAGRNRVEALPPVPAAAGPA
jgi:diguanylate cyclase (GGDEF)-like protein